MLESLQIFTTRSNPKISVSSVFSDFLFYLLHDSFVFRLISKSCSVWLICIFAYRKPMELGCKFRNSIMVYKKILCEIYFPRFFCTVLFTFPCSDFCFKNNNLVNELLFCNVIKLMLWKEKINYLFVDFIYSAYLRWWK